MIHTLILNLTLVKAQYFHDSKNNQAQSKKNQERPQSLSHNSAEQ